MQARLGDRPDLVTTHVLPGLLEHQEKLVADLTKEEGRFQRKLDRLRRVRQHLASHGGGRFAGGEGGFGEGGEEDHGGGGRAGDAFSDTSSGVYSDLSEMSGSSLTSIASSVKFVWLPVTFPFFFGRGE